MIENTSFALATLIALLGCADGLGAQDSGGMPSGSTSRLHITRGIMPHQKRSL
jgi:hypothetical protein